MASSAGEQVAHIEEMAKEKGFKSLRALALALATPGSKLSAGYLANKLRDLDKGLDLGWWTGTGREYWQVLIDALEVDESEVVGAATAGAEQPVGLHLWIFEMFPGLRPLDLMSEKLLPGLPGELTRPGGPNESPTWWVAPAGAGKTLLGRWLEVKAGWTVLRAESWAHAVQQMPESGRVYVELRSWHDAPMDPAAGDVRLCVAAAGPPSSPAGSPERDDPRHERRSIRVGAGERAVGAWRVVRSPAREDWMGPLLDWVTARLRNPHGFDLALVRGMLEDDAIQGLLQTPGEALDLFGVVDEVGFDSNTMIDPIRLAKAWIAAAAKRADRRVPAGVDLRRHGFEVLVGATTERLRRGLERVPRDVWATLIPAEHATGPDLDAIRALAESGRPEALAEIRQRLRPDSETWVAALEAIGALRDGPDGCVVRPEWLGRIVRDLSYDRLLDRGPDGVGVLLLHAGSVVPILDHLVMEIRNGELDRVEAVAKGVDRTSPEQLAWLDGAVRAVGLALGAGADVPVDLVEVLWQRALEVCAERNPALPAVPILSVAAADYWQGPTAMGAWFLAMLMMSRTLADAGRAPPPSALSPWSGDLDAVESQRLCRALSQLWSARLAAQDRDDDRLLLAIGRRVGGALLDSVGVIRDHGNILDVQLGPLVVELARGRSFEIDEGELARVLELRDGLAAVTEVCEERGVSREDVLGWCWRRWVNKPGTAPPFRWPHGSRGGGVDVGDCRAVWAIAPADLLTDQMCAPIGEWPVIWPALSPAVWKRWLVSVAATQALDSQSDAVLDALPEDLAIEAVREGFGGPPPRNIVRALWRRLPTAMSDLIDEWVRQPASGGSDGSRVGVLVWEAPEDFLVSLVERARVWVEEPDRYPGGQDWPWRWLAWIVEKRHPGWRDAFALLAARSVPTTGRRPPRRRKP